MLGRAERHVDGVVTGHVAEGVAVHRAHGHAVDLHVGDRVALVGREREGLVSAIGHGHGAGRRDAAALTGRGGDGVLLPGEHVRGEVPGSNVEADALRSILDGHVLRVAAVDVRDVKAGLCTVSVKALQVQEREVRALVGSLGIGPVNIYAVLRGNPRVAIVGVNEVQVLHLVLTRGVGPAELLVNALPQRRGAVNSVRGDDVVEEQLRPGVGG